MIRIEEAFLGAAFFHRLRASRMGCRRYPLWSCAMRFIIALIIAIITGGEKHARKPDPMEH